METWTTYTPRNPYGRMPLKRRKPCEKAALTFSMNAQEKVVVEEDSCWVTFFLFSPENTACDHYLSFIASPIHVVPFLPPIARLPIISHTPISKSLVHHHTSVNEVNACQAHQFNWSNIISMIIYNNGAWPACFFFFLFSPQDLHRIDTVKMLVFWTKNNRINTLH